MSEPPQNRDTSSLHRLFLFPFEAWLARAQQEAAHVRLFVTEARRTEERQRWLYKQGREPPYEGQPKITWTLNSRHRWGLAADLAMQRDDGSLIWTEDSWAWLYRVSELESYGLRTIAPTELVHVEYRYADEAIEEAETLDLTRS